MRLFNWAADIAIVHVPVRVRYTEIIGELTKANRPVDDVRFASGFSWLLVSNDPDKTFNEGADHIIYQANNYTAVI